MLHTHFVFFRFSLMVKNWSQEVEISRKHAGYAGIAYGGKWDVGHYIDNCWYTYNPCGSIAFAVLFKD